MKIGGIEVRDAKGPLEILVTPTDIKRGDTKNPSGCAVAVACKRQLHAVDVRVHLSRVYVKLKRKDEKMEWVRYVTPESMRSEIIAFDRGGQFEPGTHTLGEAMSQSKWQKEHRHKLKSVKPSIRLGRNVKKIKLQGSVLQRAPKHHTYHAVAGVRARGANK